MIVGSIIAFVVGFIGWLGYIKESNKYYKEHPGCDCDVDCDEDYGYDCDCNCYRR
jgi:hypothetical protein